MAGHEPYRGRLAIPYLTARGYPVSMRFRCIEHEDCHAVHPDKYRSLPGDPPRIFNVAAFARAEKFIVVCEGEIDAITATQAGLPAVGLPGVGSWRDFYSRPFAGYETVFILADNDDKGQGMEFAEKIAEAVPNPRVVAMPSGHDVNSFVLANGPDALSELLKIKGDK